ncbi:MAG: hypothetical protein K0U48_00105 [Actinomycetia bacterium]|nr:hypothetical protein [Actinomycetes bacterium]
MGNNRLEMPAAIREIVGVYHADGGVMGELRYILGKARGTAHCALCDITHSTVRRKAAWDDACRNFPHPFRLVHLNERSPEEVAACTLGTPTVLVLFADGTYRALMGPDDLELDRSVSAFFDALDRAVSRSLPSDAGLGAPGASAG